MVRADGVTGVASGERWDDHERDGLFEYFQKQLGPEERDTILGEITEVAGLSRLWVELLEDVEALLIWCVDPPGNLQ